MANCNSHYQRVSPLSPHSALDLQDRPPQHSLSLSVRVHRFAGAAVRLAAVLPQRYPGNAAPVVRLGHNAGGAGQPGENDGNPHGKNGKIMGKV